MADLLVAAFVFFSLFLLVATLVGQLRTLRRNHEMKGHEVFGTSLTAMVGVIMTAVLQSNEEMTIAWWVLLILTIMNLLLMAAVSVKNGQS
jgi:multisubunit Na+/H+ antiporter MnhG subunit